MNYGTPNTSSATGTRRRVPDQAPQSGICSVCHDGNVSDRHPICDGSRHGRGTEDTFMLTDRSKLWNGVRHE